MSTLVSLIAVYAAVNFLVVLFGALSVRVDLGPQLKPSRGSLSCFFREWWVQALVVAMLPLGFIGRGAPKRSDKLGPHAPADARTDVPVILVPGYMMNRSGWWFLMLYLRNRGWRWVWPINNTPRSASVLVYARRLDERIEELCRITGAPQVDLVAHSMGGIIAGVYINQMRGQSRVRRLVTLGTPWRGTKVAALGWLKQAADLLPGAVAIRQAQSPSVPTTAIWSRVDQLILPWDHAQPLGGTAVELEHMGHLELMLNGRAMHAVAEALMAPSADAPAPAAEA